LFEIVLDYNRLAALWDEISGDVEEVSAIHAAKLLSEKFILLSSPIAAERVANLLCDSAEGSPNVHLETWPHFLVHLASLNLVIGIFGEGAGRVGTAAFKRITIKLGLKFSAKELDQVSIKLPARALASRLCLVVSAVVLVSGAESGIGRER
jgi:hypothetical protein